MNHDLSRQILFCFSQFSSEFNQQNLYLITMLLLQIESSLITTLHHGSHKQIKFGCWYCMSSNLGVRLSDG